MMAFESSVGAALVPSTGSFLKGLIETVAAIFGTAADSVNRMIEKAYERGYVDGAAAMRESIVRATQTPLTIPAAPTMGSLFAEDQDEVESRPSPKRSPRGSVRSFLFRALREKPGATQHELKTTAKFFAGLSSTSIGNELRRNEGKMYRRDERNHWYLLETAAAGTPDEPAAEKEYRSAA